MSTTEMTQKEARRTAKAVGGVATQRTRLGGAWARPGEPWVVVLPNGDTYGGPIRKE